MENIEAQIIIRNDFGEFFGKKIIVSEDQYLKIIEMSKSFYKGSGFELTCENGDFIIFPSEIVQKSMLKITSKKIKDV